MPVITCEDVLRLAATGYFGDVYILRQDKSVHRGPVVSISKDGRDIVISAIWFALQERPIDDWHVVTFREVSASGRCKFVLDDNGNLSFGNIYTGLFKISKGRSNCLPPDRVIGLKPDEVRCSRAWMVGLPLDSSWEKIIHHVEGLGDGSSELLRLVQAEEASATSQSGGD